MNPVALLLRMALRASLRGVALVAAFVAVFAAAPRDASATPNFPAAIKTKLGAVESPDCSVCHVDGRTGRGTVNTAFGSSMRQRGLVAYDEGSLERALAAMEADRVDSDGDGTIDVDALRDGLDPNPVSAFEDPTIPRYGCIGRVAPVGPPAGSTLAVVLAALVMLAVRRRAGRLDASTLMVLAVGTATLAACVHPDAAALAPRTDVAPAVRSGVAPRMAPITPTAFEGELRAAGLDPHALPPFEALEPRQLRRLMSTFTRSLGFACTDCHDRADYRTSTRTKTISARMWNEMMRTYALDGGAAVYCDSCHHGQGAFLDRTDESAVSAFMSDNFAGMLRRSKPGAPPSAPKDGDVSCGTCHGDPFDGHFLAKW